MKINSRRIAKNIRHLLFSNLFSFLIGLIVSIYLAKTVGVTAFGQLNFSLAFISFFMVLINFGLPLLGTKEIAVTPKKAVDYVVAILSIRAVIALFLFFVLSVFIQSIEKLQAYSVLLYLYSLGFISAAITMDWVFQGLQKMSYIAISRIVFSVSFMVSVLLFVESESQLLLVPVFHVSALFLSAFFLLLSLKFLNFDSFRKKNIFSFTLGVFKKSLPLGLSIVLIQMVYYIDTIMIGFMMDDASVGIYNAAYKLIIPVIAIGAIYFDSTYPVIAKLYKTSLPLLSDLQCVTAKIMCILAFPVAIIGYILGGEIIKLIYGAQYSDAESILQLLLVVPALIYLNMIFARAMWACELFKEYNLIVAFQVVVNIILNFIFIPMYGLYAAALSTIFSEFAGLFFYYYIFNKKITYSPLFPYMIKPLIASLLIAIFAIKFKELMNVVALIFVLIVLYFGVLYLIKGVTKNDLQLFFSDKKNQL